MEDIRVLETKESDLKKIQGLWADGDVMKFVGFPEGLHETMENLIEWYRWVENTRPNVNHYSIYDRKVYCGEAFYQIDYNHDNSASLDIKLFNSARGKGIATIALSHTIKEAFENGANKVWVDPNPDNLKAIALYERLGFERKPIPLYLIEDEGTEVIYMEKSLKY
jgi:RimJ/RimL family protein N-acetyltransferase